MSLTLIAVTIAVLCVLVVFWANRNRNREDVEHHSITPEELHALRGSNQDVLVYDVRQPLDVLAHAEIIPGAKRVFPKEIMENPSIIPKDKDLVVYCTCPGDKTSREVWQKANALHFERVRFLKGGLEAWKAKGYVVEPYRESFHLDTRT